jgi:putative transposase
MIDFKGSHCPKSVILYAVFFYVRSPVFYRDLEEVMTERGVDFDHATLNRWVVKYAPLVATEAQNRKSPTDRFWRMDETYIKVKGQWCCLYRAIDQRGQTLDFMLSTASALNSGVGFDAMMSLLCGKIPSQRSGKIP